MLDSNHGRRRPKYRIIGPESTAMNTISEPIQAPVPAWEIPPEALPDVENLVTEDDIPVDNIFSEKQQRLLTESLYACWRPDQPFVALANVGLFYGIHKPPLVPDILLSLEAKMPEDVWPKANRSYFLWEYGKPPEAVVEVVSNTEGGEDTHKLETYARIGIDYYAIYDPEGQLSQQALRLYKRYDTGYVITTERYFPKLGLGLTLWTGRYEDLEATWLRWCDQEGRVIPTGAEHAALEAQRADNEAQRADSEAQRADSEAQRADSEAQRATEAERQGREERHKRERLEERLRTLGLDPEA